MNMVKYTHNGVEIELPEDELREYQELCEKVMDWEIHLDDLAKKR